MPLVNLYDRPPIWHGWSADGHYLLFLGDTRGEENFVLYSVSVSEHRLRALTPEQGVSARLLARPLDQPNSVCVALNTRDPAWHDVWRIDLETGSKTLLYENKDGLGGIVCDQMGAPRLARRSEPETGGDVLLQLTDDGLFDWLSIPFEDTLTTWPVAIDRRGSSVSLVSSIGREFSALITAELVSGAQTVIAEEPNADVIACLLDPQSLKPIAFASDPGRLIWKSVESEIVQSFVALENALPEADLRIISQSADNRFWIVESSTPQQPPQYHLLERNRSSVTTLFDTRQGLAVYRLSSMRTVIVNARDGLPLVCYLTLPADAPKRPGSSLPMVLQVHGGPWSRDRYGFNPLHQFYADRGYAVLSVNYRGSTGFGKTFLSAGDRAHGQGIQDDLTDTAQWAIEEGIANPDRIAIIGGSYGGYAAFVGVTKTPTLFRCAVSISGFADLVQLMQTLPPYWSSSRAQFDRRFGDISRADERADLAAQSPVHEVRRIVRPLMIVHGTHDIRCPIEQSEHIAAELQRRNVPVTHLVFRDEGHSLSRNENVLALYAVLEAFLARHLGGSAEPIGHDLDQSAHIFRAGADVLSDDP